MGGFELMRLPLAFRAVRAPLKLVYSVQAGAGAGRGRAASTSHDDEDGAGAARTIDLASADGLLLVASAFASLAHPARASSRPAWRVQKPTQTYTVQIKPGTRRTRP